MREIKFRAWQKNGTKMIDLQKITPLILNKDQDGVFLPFHKDIYIMQYTGLKDSKGVEIYEGDFVNHWHEEMFFQDNVIGLVVWQPDTACFEFEYSSTSQPFSNVDFNYIEPEIIGNIYEDSELVDK